MRQKIISVEVKRDRGRWTLIVSGADKADFERMSEAIRKTAEASKATILGSNPLARVTSRQPDSGANQPPGAQAGTAEGLPGI